jgi:Arc/MetJ-type ribon-helix-helix transcriptional regulator
VTTRVPVRLTHEDVARIDDLVARGRFANRSDVLRAALRFLLKEERERDIDEAYRRGYGKYPQEEWIAELGLAALAAWDKAERKAEGPG